MDYPYIRWNAYLGQTEFLPLVDVLVRFGERELSLPGLVDSGAWSCMMDKRLAHDLGIDLEKCQKIYVSGVGGKGQEGYVSTVRMALPDFGDHEFDTPIIFADTPSSLLLGQADFFTNFKVTFEKQKGTFSLYPVPQLKE